MAKRIKMISGDEYDALTKWKRHIKWRAGERKRIKRRYNKRDRHKVRSLIDKIKDTGL